MALRKKRRWPSSALRIPREIQVLRQADRLVIRQRQRDAALQETRDIYLAAKENLICEVGALKPASLRKRVQASDKPDEVRGLASIRQFSLLRTAMKGENVIYHQSLAGTPMLRTILVREAHLGAAGRLRWRRTPFRRRSRRATDRGSFRPAGRCLNARAPPLATARDGAGAVSQRGASRSRRDPMKRIRTGDQRPTASTAVRACL